MPQQQIGNCKIQHHQKRHADAECGMFRFMAESKHAEHAA